MAVNYSLDDILRTTYGQRQAEQSQLAQQFGPNAPVRSSAEMVTGNLDAVLDPNNQYIQNARQRGLEYAATRGGINSSIAAGAAERSAIEAAAPLATQATQLDANRENLAFQEYLQGRQINQEFQTQLASSAVQSQYNMLQTLQQYAMNDPTTYTPEVISGYSNFFSRNTSDILKRLLGNG